jgi:DNA-binding protein H-NS
MKELAAIRKQIEELQEQEKRILEESKLQAVEQVKQLMKEYGLTIKDLQTTKTKGKKKLLDGVVQYRDGENTWSGGRGRKPKWVQDYLNSNVDIEKFRV